MSNRILIILIDKLDELIEKQLNEFIHAEIFQKLESAWRGLDMVVNSASTDSQVKVKYLSITPKEIERDISDAIEFDQSQLFYKIYSEELDSPGGLPYGLIIVDLYVCHKPTSDVADSITLLKALARLGAAAFAPIICGVYADFLGVNQFSELPTSLNLERLFKANDYSRWKSIGSEDDARFIGLTLPRILMRQPYNIHKIKVYNKSFVEKIDKHSDYLWGNAVYAYACVIIQSFCHTGWFSDIRGGVAKDSKGAAVELSRGVYVTDPANIAPKLSVEYQLTNSQESELSQAGILAVRDNLYLRKAYFYHSNSLQKPPIYSQSVINTNARISSMLHYILCASRFAHYVKVIMRDKVGSFINTSDCERYLMQWINKYCASSENMSSLVKQRYPLNEASIKVSENPQRPGCYHCVLHIKPHFQLDSIQARLRFVTEYQHNNAHVAQG